MLTTNHFICPCCEVDWCEPDNNEPVDLLSEILLSESPGLRPCDKKPTCSNCGEEVEPLAVYKEESIDDLD